ncbi:hypothetical protein BDZ89DRAFT_1131819 [Hymenopellis radicata]|nr:hypothetical protein BDZ89DRAFT_1131819 [Hymenopellis radicata]
MASVRANPEINFLLIKYTQESEEQDGKGCMAVPGLGETLNAREVCLGVDEYWSMRAEWICARWNDCAEGDIELLKGKMKARANVDMYNAFFRPFRAAIFSRWVDPRTLIWGITDLDEMRGSFDRTFPWDLAPSFDVIASASHPRRDPFLSYIADEAEWSHYTILNPNLTFLTFPAMIRTDGHISTCDGVFGFDNVGKKQTRPYHLSEDGSEQSMLTLGQRQEFIQAIKDQQARTKGFRSGQRPQTFTGLGDEYEEYSVHYSPNYSRVPRYDVNRYLMRRAPNGPVTERVEPNPPIPIQVTSDATEAKHEWDSIRIGEALYNHFQMEKYQLYWSLPEDPLKPDEYMFMDRYTGLEIWDSDGRVKFSRQTVGRIACPYSTLLLPTRVAVEDNLG